MWQEWLAHWLEAVDMPLPSQLPSDQFSVSTETGMQFVIENCIDHILISVRMPINGYTAEHTLRRLLFMADPQCTNPFQIRLGQDGFKYTIVAIRLNFDESNAGDLVAAFEQLWGLAEELTNPGFM